MANFTKGEWIKQGSFIFSSEKPPRLIAEVIRHNMSFNEQQANAHLIAAAPRMAGLLLESREFIGGDWRERRDKVLKEVGVL